MGMTIDEAIYILENGLNIDGSWQKALSIALDTMRKYQKIEDIYYHQSGEALENSLRAVIEDGNAE